MLLALITGPVVSSPSMGANIPRGPTRVLATGLCIVCFICYC